MGDGEPIGAGAAARLTSKLARRRKRRLFVAAAGAGLVLGVVGVVGVGSSWLEGYLESPRLWQDLGAASGLELSSASSKASLWPLGLRVAKLEGRREGTKVFEITATRLELSWLKLLTGVARADVLLEGVQLFARAGSEKAPGVAPNTTGVPKSPLRGQEGAAGSLGALPFRRFELKARAEQVHLPWDWLPATRFELEASAEGNDKGGFKVLLGQLKALGFKASGEADLDGKLRGPFHLELPEGESLVSGKVQGKLAPEPAGLEAAGELKLPNTTVTLPKNQHWLVGGKPIEVEGQAALGGSVHFEWLGASGWNGQGSWDLDLGAAKVVVGSFEKKVASPARARGKFAGTQSHWQLSELALDVGEAHATLEVSQDVAAGMEVRGQLEPVEIAPFMPLVSGLAPGLGRITGRASAEVDLKLDSSSEPSGKVSAALDHWSLDAPTIAGLARAPALKLEGSLGINGSLTAELERGGFKDGAVKLVFDASSLGLGYGKTFRKSAGQTLVVDVTGQGTGKSLQLSQVRLTGPGALKLVASGTVADLKDYSVQLKLAESRIPLPVLAQCLPGAARAAGTVDVSGELQGTLKSMAGLFAKLRWKLKNVSLEHEALRVRKLGGEVETIISDSREGDGEDLAPGLGWIVRSSSLAGQVQAETLGDKPVSASLQGEVEFKNKGLGGEIDGELSELDLRALLARRTGSDSEADSTSTSDTGYQRSDIRAQKSEVGVESGSASASALPLDFATSSLKLKIQSPRITTPYVSFTNAEAALTLGRRGLAEPAPDVTIERLAGNALGGELSARARLTFPSRVQLSATADEIDMIELGGVLSKLSGKDMKQEMFGRGHLSVDGHLEGLATADFQGKAEIRDGGFRFLPLPSTFAQKLQSVPTLRARLPLDSGGKLSSRLEKAETRFHLKGERLDLEVEAADSRMGMSAKGYVTLAGTCDLSGKLRPAEALLGSVKAELGGADAAVPFTSKGEQWQCGFTPELGSLAAAVAKARLGQEVESRKAGLVEKARSEAGKALQNSFKGLFGN